MECFNTIVTALKKVKRPGFYATGGIWPMPLPSVSVSCIQDGFLGLPLCDAQAKVIVDSCTLAPFGRGEETIVDINVRRTWQLSPTQFSINNKEWKEQLQALLAKVKADLGCDSNMNVTCELYKLLLYEPGGFFKVSKTLFYFIVVHTKIGANVVWCSQPQSAPCVQGLKLIALPIPSCCPITLQDL